MNDEPIGWVDNEQPPLSVFKINNYNNNNNRNSITNNNNDDSIDDEKQLQQHNGSNTILSVFYHELKLGVAYYDKLESNIYLCQSWEDENFSCLHLIKQQVNPKVIIIPSRMPQKFIDNIHRNLDDNSNNNNNSSTTTPDYHFSRFSDFTYESSKNRLLNLKLSMCNTNDTATKYQFLQNIFNFENIEMIRAVGGLLSYLSKYLLLDDFDSLENLIINEICPITLDQYLLLDNNSLYSLQIFSNQNHPSCYAVASSKEGLSLFGLFDKTKTSMGKKLLKTWFMRPSRNRKVIEDRQDLIQFFSSPENAPLKSELLDHLKNIKDLRIVLSRIFSSQSPSKDFISIYKTFHFFLKIKLLLISKNSELEFIKKLEHLYPQSLVDLYQRFENTFEFDSDKKLQIREGVDEDLDHLRNVYNSMDDVLTELGELEGEKFSKITWITSFRLVYYPQLGCLVSIPVNEKVSMGTQINVPTLTFLFQSSTYLYFQNQKTHELNQFFGDIHSDLNDINSKIERQLIDAIMENSSSMIDLCNYSAELDCILSLSTSVKNYDLVKPIISDQIQEIEIENGRHLVQEQCVANFIPNDTIDNVNKPIVVVSGPNQSGKSIYIKQVALIVFLAQVGSFVPATSARISLFDRIYTRISSRESNAVSESSFMIDCKQIAQMTRFATSRSLLIIDEYGKGTNPLDGISLLYGLMHFLLSKSPTSKTFICTHFYELFELLSISSDDSGNLFDSKVLYNTMEFMIKTNKNNNNNSSNNNQQQQSLQDLKYSTTTATTTNQAFNNIFSQSNRINNNTYNGLEDITVNNNDNSNIQNEFIPFYKLKEGVSNSSFGMLCAKNAGVGDNIVNRAFEIMEYQKQYKTIDPSKLKTFPLKPSKVQLYNQLLDLIENFDPLKDSGSEFLKTLNK